MSASSDSIVALVQIAGNGWVRCERPVRIFESHEPGDVRSILAEVERLSRERGLHAVGVLAYEAGTAFGLETHASRGPVPVIWFSLFDPADVKPAHEPRAGADQFRTGPLEPTVDRVAFRNAFAQIRHHIAEGDTYQANFTFQISGAFEGEPEALFASLVRGQRPGHARFVQTPRWAICSASPELFFAFDGLTIGARPMKGTAPRGRTTDEDRIERDGLASSAKERAENVMIVDMVRNDLGRVAETGSVTVDALFAVERYPTLWQMTSTVSARSVAPLADVLEAMHPSASVTGAPKVRTMQILRALETGPRGVYTGAIGYIPPDGNAVFNVAIRTAVIDREAGQVAFGVGSGIVWDSDPEAEYDECLLKARVLCAPVAGFELLETLRWTPAQGFLLLDRHLARLKDSAAYFGIAVDGERVRATLAETLAGQAEPQRVRLLVGQDGQVRAERAPLVASAEPLRVRLAQGPVDVSDVFLFHKTTRREVYTRARDEAPGFDEVILWNDRGEVTEATTANVVIERADGSRVTPPVSSGLLAGTYRAELLETGQVVEAPVTRAELAAASGIWLVNSVHEWRHAVLVA